MGTEEIRSYQASPVLGPAKAGNQQDLLPRNADRGEQLIVPGVHLNYRRAKRREP